MNFAEMGQWYYLIYLVPGGAALLTLSLAFMGADQSDSGDSGDAGDTGHTGHMDGGDAGDQGTDRGVAMRSPLHPVPHSAGAHSGSRALHFFGFGSIPAPFAWGSVLLGWSLFGFWATQMLKEHAGRSTGFVLPAMGVALLGALLTARCAAVGVSKLMPAEKSTAIGTVDLVGLTGETAYAVDTTRGRIIVYDQFGVMHDSQARVPVGQPKIPRGKKAMVVDYDPKRDALIVEEVA